MRYRIAVIVAVLTCLALIVALPTHAQETTPSGGGDPAHGAELFAANCAVCHGQKGEGRVGATLNDVFVSMNINALLEETITQGRPGTFMPTWGQAYGGPLSDQDVADIIAYIKSWGTTYEPPLPVPPVPPQEIPPVPEVSGDPNLGYTIFQQNCAACHGDQGQGRIGATLNTAFPAIEGGAMMVETIKRGVSGSLMPAWSQSSGGPLTDDDINNVAAYVLSIQKSPRPAQGEVVQTGSAWPLVIAAALIVVVIFALGIAVSRREAK